VLLALADACSRDDGTGCWPSAATVARKANISDRTVRRVITRLEAEGHLIVHRGGGRTGSTNSYTVVTSDCVIHTPGQNDTPDNLSGGDTGDRPPLTGYPWVPSITSLESVPAWFAAEWALARRAAARAGGRGGPHRRVRDAGRVFGGVPPVHGDRRELERAAGLTVELVSTLGPCIGNDGVSGSTTCLDITSHASRAPCRV
jgi:hypothetical protein